MFLVAFFLVALTFLSDNSNMSVLLVLEFIVFFSLRFVSWYNEWFVIETWTFSSYGTVFYLNLLFWLGFSDIVPEKWGWAGGGRRFPLSLHQYLRCGGFLLLLGAGERLGDSFSAMDRSPGSPPGRL